MFVKIPQQKDELKESIEKISKQSKKQGKVSQQSQADYQEKIIERIKENIGEFENGLQQEKMCRFPSSSPEGLRRARKTPDASLPFHRSLFPMQAPCSKGNDNIRQNAA